MPWGGGEKQIALWVFLCLGGFFLSRILPVSPGFSRGQNIFKKTIGFIQFWGFSLSRILPVSPGFGPVFPGASRLQFLIFLQIHQIP